MYPWGNELVPNKTHRANIFQVGISIILIIIIITLVYQGRFPKRNSKEDGYEFGCPVNALGPQNDYGLYNMIGKYHMDSKYLFIFKKSRINK